MFGVTGERARGANGMKDVLIDGPLFSIGPDPLDIQRFFSIINVMEEVQFVNKILNGESRLQVSTNI